VLTRLSLLSSSRALLEGKSIENLIRGTWASVHEAYVAVVTAAILLLKLDAQVHDWAFKGTSLGGRTRLSSWLFSLLRCKMSLILPKHLYGVTPEGMENRKVIPVMATWWCHGGEMQGRVVE